MAARKSKGVTDAAAAESTRLNIHISAEAHRRLGVHSIMGGTTPGRLVEKLINEHLREWRVQANAAVRGTAEDRLDRAGPVTLEAMPAAI